ncbi:MAG: metallophosphoesterase [Allorhizobium sp.]
MDKLVNVLHISDIHLDASAAFAQDLVLKAFLEDLPKLNDLGLKPDLIVISGDLAKAADQENAYSVFLNFIIKLLEEFGLDEERLILCPGNHDVSRKVVGPVLPTIKSWRTSCENRDEANKIQDDTGYTNHVLRTFRGFYELTDSFSQKSIIQVGSGFTTYFFRELGVSFVSINTATLSTAGLVSPRDDERNLIVPEKLLVEALSTVPKDSHKIVVGHHPTSWLTETNEELIRRLLGKSANMYLCGHIHMARPETVTGMLGTCHFAQTGALYEWRDHWSGYCVYQIVPGAPHVKAHYRRWYEDRREFSKAEDLADEGIIYSTPDAKGFFAKLKLQILPSDLEDWRVNTLLPNLIDECNKSLAPVPIEDAFVAPEFQREVKKSPDALDLVAKKETITFDAAISSHTNYVISATGQSGKSTLLRQWAIRLARKSAVQADWSAPVLIDFSELRDYPAYLESLTSRQLPPIPAKLGGVGRLLDQGRLTFLIDDVDFQNRPKLKALGQFMEKYPNCRYVVASVDILFEGASVSPVITGALPFTHVQLRPLRRKDLLSLINGHNVVNSELSADALLERVTREARGLNVPLNPVTASFLIQIFSTEPDLVLVNRATLVERYIELLLQKFSRPDVELRSFDFKLKRDLLSKIAQQMVESEDHEPHYNDVMRIILDYLDHYGFPQEANAILDHFVSCRILEKVERENGAGLRFPLTSFFHYFVAFRMTEDENFRVKIFDPINYLSFSEEVTYYAALARNDEKLLEYVFAAFSRCSEEMWADASEEVRSGHFIETFNEPNAEASKEDLFAIDEVIRSNEQIEAAREYHLNGEVDGRVPNQKVRRPVYRTVGDQWTAHLFLASQVLKHMELIPKELKKKYLRDVVKGWLQFCAFSLTLVPRLIVDKTVELNGVLYKLNFNSHEPVGELARRISLVMPIAVSYMATTALGSEKLKLQLSEGLGTKDLAPSEQLMQGLLLADIGVSGIVKILENTTKSVAPNPYLSKVLLSKLYDVAIRFRLDRKDVERVRNLAGDLLVGVTGQEKHGKRREKVIENLRRQRLLLDMEK